MYILFNIFIILHWLTNNNKCILSEMDNEEPGGYTSRCLEKINININPDSIFIDIFSYSLLIILIFLALYKIKYYPL